MGRVYPIAGRGTFWRPVEGRAIRFCLKSGDAGAQPTWGAAILRVELPPDPHPESDDMPTDAKLGLLVGVGLVLAVAILFFQKDSPPAASAPDVQTRPVSPPAAVRPPAPADPDRTMLPGRPASRVADDRD